MPEKGSEGVGERRSEAERERGSEGERGRGRGVARDKVREERGEAREKGNERERASPRPCSSSAAYSTTTLPGLFRNFLFGGLQAAGLGLVFSV